MSIYRSNSNDYNVGEIDRLYIYCAWADERSGEWPDEERSKTGGRYEFNL